MIISSKKIKANLKKIWPLLSEEENLIWLSAEEYPTYDSLEELQDVVNKCIEVYLENPPGYECEYRAHQLMAAVWRYDYKFFGETKGILFRNRPGNHTLNIALVQDQFYFIDPKDAAIWKGRKDNDQPYFVRR